MSYSFSINAAKDKDDAVQQYEERFKEVLANQPLHGADAEHAEAAFASVLSMLPDHPPEGYLYQGSCSGWVAYDTSERSGDDLKQDDLRGISMTVSMSLVKPA